MSVGVQSFVFWFSIQKYTDQDIQKFNFSVVLYGCETWSLIFKEEHKLRVYENRVLRRIVGPNRDEVTGEWWKLHNEEHHALSCSPTTEHY
jgi:hypothetical protein